MSNRMIVILFIFLVLITGCATTSETIDSKSNKTILYESKKFGYTLEFPVSWEGNYIIHENDDFIEVCFIGQSETSKGLFYESDKIQGLRMFCIGKESFIHDGEFLDSVYEIGESGGEKYYYFTGTDYPIGGLMDEYIEDEEEKKLMASDLIKAKEMEKDIESILNTFKESK